MPAGLCAVTSLDVTVMDGLPEHNRTIQVPLTVIDRGFLQTDAGAGTALAGGAAVGFTASIVGGCSPANLSWSTSDGQMGTGGQFSWTPPLTECTAGGRQITVITTATWPTGTPPTTSASQVVTIVPWGAPTPPSFTSGAQRSGTTKAWLSSGTEHACSTSNGFPGTELVWTNRDAGAASIVDVDGGLIITSPVSCVGYQVSGTARRQVVGETAGRISAPATLAVDILPDTDPLDATTPLLATFDGGIGILFGGLAVDAGCLAERGLEARVTVFNQGAFVVDGGFPVIDGGWSLPIPGGCSGGTYEVIAALYQSGTPTGAVAQGSVSLTAAAARVGTLPIDHLDVVCGVGAKASLTLTPDPNACGSVDLTWRATSGPSLVTVSGSGPSLELQSQALDFSAVGQQIALDWVADAGAGNLDVATRTIDLTVQPFLEASVHARPPLRREEEAFTIEVTLKNTTACAVDGLSVTLPLRGGSPVLESLLVDKARATARQTDQGLVIDGVSVPASGSVSIQLSARARLLSSPTLEPVASLNGFVVSSILPIQQPPNGCGCSDSLPRRSSSRCSFSVAASGPRGSLPRVNVLGFHHVAVQVRDVARVAAFYVERLKLPELQRFHREDGSLRSIWVATSSSARPEAGFIAIEEIRPQTPPGALGYSMVALRIEAGQRKAIVEELARAGLPIERETAWTMYLRDPEGNLVGLSHHPEAAP